MKHELLFKREKETPNTWRFFAVDANNNALTNPIISTIYIQKSQIPKIPEIMKIILEY